MKIKQFYSTPELSESAVFIDSGACAATSIFNAGSDEQYESFNDGNAFGDFWD